jgi:hypothetical protein
VIFEILDPTNIGIDIRSKVLCGLEAKLSTIIGLSGSHFEIQDGGQDITLKKWRK